MSYLALREEENTDNYLYSPIRPAGLSAQEVDFSPLTDRNLQLLSLNQENSITNESLFVENNVDEEPIDAANGSD